MIKRIASGLVVAALIVTAGLVANMLPLRAQYAQQMTLGAELEGATANAQEISLGAGNVVSLADLTGVQISFIVGSGLTNTGPATLKVDSFTAKNIYRRNGGALIALGGGEMPAGDLVKATYDGTQFELDTDYTGGDNVGTIKPVAYANADPGYVLLYGEAVSRTTYAALYAKIGTTFGSGDGSTTFNVPDLRGGIPAGLDNMGGTAANRITSAVSGVAGTTLGASGGSQGYASGIAQTYLKSFSLPFTNPTYQGPAMLTSNQYSDSGSGPVPYVSGGSNLPITLTTSGSVTSGGGSTAFPTLPYVQIVAYEMKL